MLDILRGVIQTAVGERELQGTKLEYTIGQRGTV